MDFDCFLSHNSKDKPAVRALAARLTAAGVRVWLDEEQLVPGRNWQPLLAEGIERSATGAVLIGADGLGPWEDEEMQALLRRAVREGRPVIPVLLPGAPQQPELPLFLANRTWADLRDGLAGAGFDLLLWGIRGRRSGAGDTPVSQTDQDADAPPDLPCLRVFLASPGDVADERRLAAELIEQLPRLPELRGRLRVDLIAWDKPGAGAPLLATMNPQEALAAGRPRPSECQVVVVILGWRLGRPLDPHWQTRPDGRPYRSGTEWEYLDALAAAEARGTPDLLVYRKRGVPAPAFDDPDYEEIRAQWDAVKSFFADFTNPDGSARRAWTDYDSPTDLAERLQADLAALAARRLPPPAPVGSGAAPPAPGAPAWDRAPYPGLHALRAADAPIFCGRGAQTDDLIRLLAEPARRCLTVVGASGSGKSSLVWAGLLPRLAGNALPGAKDWPWVRFTPMELGDDPLLALAGALAHGFERCRWEAGRLAPLLATPAGLARTLDQALAGAPAWAELLLFVDQLEEVFRLPDPAVRERFIEQLAVAAARPRVRLLATLRADFVPDLTAQPRLAALYNQGNYLLTPPLQPARVRMVTEPAQRAGLDLEPGLAERIVADTGDQPGALPLMAYALERLYESDRGRPVLTHASYVACGEVHGAIATQAGLVFADFAAGREPGSADAALAALFRELVRVEGAEAPVTRRRAPLARLGPTGGPAADLAERLVRQRLLVKDHQPTAGGRAESVVDVAHEALLTHWDLLARWIEERRDDLRLRDLLRRSVEDWERSGYHHTYITLGPERARVAREALAHLGQTPTAPEDAFLDPVARAAWLLGRDTDAWVLAGRGAVGLWDAQRFAGFADLAPGSLAPPTAAARDFLAASFAACLATLVGQPRARAACGQALGALGDPRFDPDTWHLPADPTLGYREVPAGPFRMGTDPEQDPNGWSDEEPQHDQDLPALWLARWPVTVAQFAAFVAASGHRPAEADAWQGHPNHPVVYVTWHDARAYCAWHGDCLRALAAARLAALGPPAAPVGAGCGRDAPPASEPEPQPAARRFWQAVAAGQLQPGLPSEPEWEKAARGTDARIYAGGNTLTPDLANYKDTALKATSAVGCFPAGAGPYGCEDQTGNVWEWTRSLWGPDYMRVGFKYPYEAKDGREDSEASNDLARVLRGGAFAVDRLNCRGAVRFRLTPHYRNDFVGFRVVWSPFLCSLSPLDSEPLNL